MLINMNNNIENYNPSLELGFALKVALKAKKLEDLFEL